jgi:homogentisate 1,2-dioxygenase
MRRPTHASWLNQVEVWFSILASKALAGVSFTSPRQVRDRIDAFIAAYNQDSQPFEWTKQVVFSQHPRSKYANLRNWVLGATACRKINKYLLVGMLVKEKPVIVTPHAQLL